MDWLTDLLPKDFQLQDILPKLQQWAQEPKFQAALGAVLLVLIYLFYSSRKKQARLTKGPRVNPEVDRLVRQGNYDSAAQLEQKNGNLEIALEYFLRAQRPGRAAQIAQQLGRAKQAGELYEKVMDYERAASMYRQAGLKHKADELDQKAKAKSKEEATDTPGQAALEDDTFLTPLERAQRSEKEFHEIRQKAQDGDPAAEAQLKELGRELADALLAAGETERAAAICRDAGLTDQAINLYVNLLGDPGSAAPLLARRGDHKRAAELYEAAGEKERALSSWVSWSKEATDPLLHLDQVEVLGVDAVNQYLDEVLNQRPVSQDNLELHYSIATALAGRQQHQAAANSYKQISKVAPDFKDVKEKLAELNVIIARAIKLEDQYPEDTELKLDGSDPFAPLSVGADMARESIDDQAEELEWSDSPEADDMASNLEDVGTSLAAMTSQPLDELPTWQSDALELDDLELDHMVSSPAVKKLFSKVASKAAREAADLVQAKQQKPVMTIQGVQAPAMTSAGNAMGQRVSIPLDISLKFANDDIVDQARKGPSAGVLRQKLGQQSPQRDNLDLFYQLGLAHQVAGQWIDAREAFEAVEKVQPGFRDAAERAKELSDWEVAVSQPIMNKSAEGDSAQRYRLLGELGRGGMAVVYRAMDEALGREVALKFISDEITAKKRILDLFQREARASAKLNHPNIITVHDVGTLDGRAFICMELVPGRTVEDMLEDEGRLKVFDALSIAEKVLEALDYAHGKQIIHRDIKPSNIMCTDDGLVKLMDFGLAKSVEGGGKTTVVAGTPNFMAPEQFTGKNIDASTDLFAFGATLYEMLAGQSPFNGMLRDQPPPTLSKTNPMVPRVLADAIHRTMEFDQAKRTKSARELLHLIRQILTSVADYLKKDTADQPREAAARETVPQQLSASLEEALKAPRLVETGKTILGVGLEPEQDGARTPGPPSGRSKETISPSGTILHGFKPKQK